MLADNELAWLKRRQFFNGFYTTSGCLTCSLNETLCDKTDCPLHPDLEDALEFSERVVVRLANYIETLGWKGCGKHALEQARLQVEKEMDAENG